jgi:hypothetical protein
MPTLSKVPGGALEAGDSRGSATYNENVGAQNLYSAIPGLLKRSIKVRERQSEGVSERGRRER